MRQLISRGLAAALLLSAGMACKDDATGNQLETSFSATLTGAAERPTAVTTSASGTSTVSINDAASTLTVTVSASNLLSPIMAHIHVGATDVAGPIVVNLLLTAPAAGTFNGALVNAATFSATAVIGGETFTTLAAKIRSGNAYINVHTVANTGGEIRGQLAAQ